MLWYGLWGPKGLAAETVGRVNATVQGGLQGAGASLSGSSRSEPKPVTEDAAKLRGRFIDEEVQRGCPHRQEAGIRARMSRVEGRGVIG